MDPRDIEICLGHGGFEDDQGGAMAPPIVQTSLFRKGSFRELAEALHREHAEPVYSRGTNPTVRSLERKLAALEGTEACLCFGSGMAAISAALVGLLKGGDRVLFVNRIYGPTLSLAERLGRFGIGHDRVLSTDLRDIAEAVRAETRMIYFESPGTMTFRMVDGPALVAMARDRGILTVFDNTWATPLFQKPASWGVDLIVHSLTKYIGGHSDVVAGAMLGRRGTLERLFYDALLLFGGVLAPFDAWVLHRGLRTLPARMERHHRDGLAVARFLEDHRAVRRVHHPFLGSDRTLAESLLSGASGLFSFELASDRFEDVCAFIDGLRLFRPGVSWGGVESLVISPNRGGAAGDPATGGLAGGLVRLSIGLEGADALITDLAAALSDTGGS